MAKPIDFEALALGLKPEESKDDRRRAVEQINTGPDQPGDPSFPRIFNEINCRPHTERQRNCNRSHHKIERSDDRR